MVLLVLMALSMRSMAAESVRVCTTDWPPHTVGMGTDVSGTHTTAVIEVFRRLDMQVIIDSVPWERCWNELRKGTYQAVYSASYRDDRALTALYPSTPLQTLTYVAIIRKGHKRRWDGNDFATLPQPVGVPRGYSIGADLSAKGVLVDDGAINDEANFKKLLAGGILSTVVERLVTDSIVHDLGIADQVEILPAPVGPAKNYYIVLGKRAGGSEEATKELLVRLDKVLSDMAREQFLERMTAGIWKK